MGIRQSLVSADRQCSDVLLLLMVLMNVLLLHVNKRCINVILSGLSFVQFTHTSYNDNRFDHLMRV